MQQDGMEALTTGEKVMYGAAGSALAVLLFPVDPVNATVIGTVSVASPFVQDPVTAADTAS